MTDEELRQLDECLSAEDGLTPSEIDFVERLDQVCRSRELSVKQAEWLKDIADRVC